MFYTNGDKYEGYWKNDLKNGEGILTYSTGNIQKGFWKDGKKDGQEEPQRKDEKRREREDKTKRRGGKEK